MRVEKHVNVARKRNKISNGRRKDQYRTEFILALKIIGDGEVSHKDMRSSWAGATGLTQFLPSEFYKHGVDFDRDGRRDIWNSVPDALASAAQQLVNKGWQPGVRWAYEVRAPANVDCTLGVPEVTKPIGQWNSYEIVCIGQAYTVRMNGEVVLNWTDPGRRTLKGFIGLQNYNDKKTVRHRNVRIKPLP